MGSRKSHMLKLRLGRLSRQTKWAPFWAVFKRYGAGKKVHPSQMTRIRRLWRREKIQKKLKRIKPHKFKSGRIKKKVRLKKNKKCRKYRKPRKPVR